MWILYHQVIFCVFGTIAEAVLCPNENGWAKNENNCLELSQTKKNWMEANAECKANSGRLISILSEKEQQSMLDLLETEKTTSRKNDEYWIGAHIPALVFPSYFDQCIDGYDYRDESCYQILPEKLRWKIAKESCEKRGGKLASIKDEDTNVFVSEAMLEMVDKRDVNSGKDKEISYWIDGHSDGTALEFFDSDEQPLTYTNFMSSAVQNGPSCLEVFPESTFSKDTLNAGKLNTTEDEYSVEDDDDLSILGIPDEIAQTTVVSYSASTYTTYETNTAVPVFNIIECNELRLAVCEFSLTKTKNGNQTKNMNKEKNKENKIPAKNPSYLSSCSELVGLSYHSKKMTEKKTKHKSDLVKAFSTLKDGNYIIKDRETSTFNNVSHFKLQYCYLGQGDYTSDGSELFEWVSFETKESNENVTFSEYNLLYYKDVFEGACTYASFYDENWITSACDDKHRYICEYSEKEANERFCKISKTKTEQCDQKDDLKELNENSRSLLEAMRSPKMLSDHAVYSSVLDSLWEMTFQARASLSGASDPQTTEGSVNNFTSNIINAASILLDTGPATKTTQDSVIGLVNRLGEYAADTIALLKIQNGKTQNVTKLSVTSPEIKLQIYVVGNATAEMKNDALESFTSYNPEKGENIKMMMTSEAKTLSEKHGVSFINAQYTNLHQTMPISKSSEKMSDGLMESFSNSEILDKLNSTIDGNSPPNDATSIFKDKGTTYMIMATNILTATLRINGSSFSTNVRFSMERKNTNQSIVPGSETCAFLSEDGNKKDSELTWSSKGCHMVESNNDRFFCKCNHTTDFAVLLMVFEPEYDILDGHREYLFVLTIIGHFSTIICLFVSILIFLLLKHNIKSDRRVIHINLFLSLMLAHITMVISVLTNTIHNLGIVDDVTETSQNVKCMVFTYFTHLLLLSAMFWMLVEGIVIYRKIVVVLSRQSNAFTSRYYFIGWGIPFAIATICICTGLLTDREYNSTGCWLSIESGIVWAFAAPAIFVIMVNTGIIIMVLKVAMRTQKRRVARLSEIDESEKSKLTRKAYLKTAVRGALVLTPLLGLTWMCGLVMFHFSVAYIFVVLNAFQGVSIFICYCACNPEVRAALDNKWKHYKARKFSTISDDRTNKKPKQSSKSRLLMRLSFSTSLRTRNGKFSSVENSSTANEKHNEKNQDVFVQDITPMSSPASDRSHYFGRLSSASTRSTCLSQQASSLTSLRDSVPSGFFSQTQLRKMSSRVRPLSSGAEMSEESRVETTRPFSADAVMTRQAFVYPVDSPAVTKNYINEEKTIPELQSSNREKESCPIETFSLRSKEEPKETVRHHHQTGYTDVQSQDVIELEDEILNSEKSESITEYPPANASVRSENTGTCDLCCRQYYNIFGDDSPITVYSNAWRSKTKKKKTICPSVKLRRKSTAESVSQRSMRTNSTLGKRSSFARVSLNVTRKKKSISRLHSSKLDVLHSRIKTRKSEKQTRLSRPNSGDSRDSGISPDDA